MYQNQTKRGHFSPPLLYLCKSAVFFHQIHKAISACSALNPTTTWVVVVVVDDDCCCWSISQFISAKVSSRTGTYSWELFIRTEKRNKTGWIFNYLQKKTYIRMENPGSSFDTHLYFHCYFGEIIWHKNQPPVFERVLWHWAPRRRCDAEKA